MKRGSEENLGPARHYGVTVLAGAWGYCMRYVSQAGATSVMQKTCATSGGALAHIRALYRDPCAAAGSCTSWWHRRDCVRMHKRVQTPARKHAHAHGSQLMNVRGYCDTQSLSPARTRAGQHYGAVFSVLAGLGTGAVRLPLATNNAPAAAATATTTCQGFRGDQRKMRTRCQSGAWPLVRDRESVHVARRHSSRRAWGGCAPPGWSRSKRWLLWWRARATPGAPPFCP